MKLSENTLNLLKNFSTINKGIYVKAGNKLQSITHTGSLMAEATVEENFPISFAIEDLNKVLGVIDRDSIDVEFEKSFLAINSIGKTRIRYAEPEAIDTAPEKGINVSYENSCSLSADEMRWIIKTAMILKCPTIIFKSDGTGQEINVMAGDIEGKIVDEAVITVKGKVTSAFNAIALIEYFKFIPGSYDVSISSRGAIRFKNTTKDLTYWVAVEEKSTFGK